jgi:misacylated tRNA(Ala) deacylase
VAMTRKLYLDAPYRADFVTTVTAVECGWVALAETAFFTGGGGQPADGGSLELEGRRCPVTGLREDAEGLIWHEMGSAEIGGLDAGSAVRGEIDWPRRYAFMRHHTLLHIANAVVLADHGGLITGVQIGEETSRIDFNLDGFGREQTRVVEERINQVIARGLAVDAHVISEDEFRARPELVRTASVAPPVVGGLVRVVRIRGFDAQACGGTHVRNTSELGECRITRFDNKGKSNKRFYLRLGPGG